MPEQIKRLISVDDIKLIGAVVSILMTGFIFWSDTQSTLIELEIRSEIEAQEYEKQLVAIKELTEVLQELTITYVKLEGRLKSLEREK